MDMKVQRSAKYSRENISKKMKRTGGKCITERDLIKKKCVTITKTGLAKKKKMTRSTM